MNSAGNTTLNNLLLRIPVIALTFLYSIFLIKLLGPEGNGLFSYISASIGFTIIVFGFNIKRSTLYHIAKKEFDSAKVLSYTLVINGITILIVTFFTIMGYLLPSALSYFFVPESYFTVFYLLFFLASFTMQFLTELFKTILIAIKKFKANNRLLLISSLLQSSVYLIGFILVKSSSFEPSMLFLFSLILMTQFTISLVAFFFFKKYYDGGINFKNRSIRRPFLRYTSLAYTDQIGQFLNKRLDVWFVEFYTGLKNLGIYALASQFTNFLLEGITPIQEVLKPHLVNTERAEGNKFFNSIFKVVLYSMTIASLLLILLAGPLISILFGPEFIDATLPLRILSIGVIFIALKRLFLSYNRSYNEQRYNAYAQWFGVLITIIFDLLLIPTYGIVGAAWASTISYTLSFLLAFTIYYRSQDVNLFDLFIPNREEVSLFFAALRQSLSSSQEE